MIEATLAFLRARQDERVALAGVIAGLFCDDVDEAVRRLEAVRDSAKECKDAAPRNDRKKKAIYSNVAAIADDMIAPVKQLAEVNRGI